MIDEKNECGEPLSLGEMFQKEYPPIIENIKGLLPAGGLGLIAAEPKCFKSFLAMCLARDYSSKEPKAWLEHFDVTGGITVYITDNSENTEQQFFQRMKLLGCTGKEKIYFINPDILGVPRIDVCDSLIYSKLKEKLAELELKENDLLIWDSFVRIFNGDENKANDIDKNFRFIRSISPAAGIIIHHLRKPAIGESGVIFNRIRGSIDILGAVDTAMLLVKKANALEVHSTCRYFEAPEKFLIEMTHKENGNVDFKFSGDTIEKKNCEKVYELIKTAGGILRKDLIPLCEKEGIPKRRLMETLSKLFADKVIFKEKRQPKNQSFYYVNNKF